MRRSWLRMLALGIGLVLLWPVAPVTAQSGERITAYDVDVMIDPDGSTRITERIRYDFGTAERRGIFREIPVRERYDGSHDRLWPIDDITVSAEPAGTPSDLQIEREGRGLRLRIGDPDVTITGEHEYTISYVVRGALNAFDDHDELYWDVVGHGWTVPIDAVTVRVQAPAAVLQTACFTGPQGSSLACERAETAGDTAEFGHQGLGPGEGVTIVVATPVGAISPRPTPILEERLTLAKAFEVRPATVATATVLGLAGAGGLVWLLQRGRDRRARGSHVDRAFVGRDEAVVDEPVPLFGRSQDPVEFAPPEGILPGQVGTLFDERADVVDVIATIVHLAVRGYLRISEEVGPDGTRPRKPDYALVRLDKDASALHAYERLLLDSLFADGPTVVLSDLKYEFAPKMRALREALYDDAMANGWFRSRPDHTRLVWRIIGVIVLAGGIAALVIGAANRWGLAMVPLPLLGLALVLAAGRMPSRTAHGSALMGRVRGFRQLFEAGQAERERFAERAGLFTEYLPYAIVFGMTERWAKAFEGLDAEIAPTTATWWVSPYPFSVMSFGAAVDGFSTVAAGTLPAVQSTSASGGSGFSGGFSGGGGGGGGGGSW